MRVRSPLALLLVAVLTPTLGGCTTGQGIGAGVMGVGAVMMVGGLTTETRCTGDRPCCEGGERITHGPEPGRPGSIRVGVVGGALGLGGAAMVIAFAPPARKPPPPNNGPP